MKYRLVELICFQGLLKMARDGDDLTYGGRLFQTKLAEYEKDLSPAKVWVCGMYDKGVSSRERSLYLVF